MLPEMDAGAGIVEDPVGRLPVQQTEVIRFQKVLQHDFVIAPYLHAPLMDELQVGQRQMSEILRNRIEEMLQRWSVVRFADEYPVAEQLAAKRDEAPAQPVRGAPIPRVRDRGQGTDCIVRPPWYPQLRNRPAVPDTCCTSGVPRWRQLL